MSSQSDWAFLPTQAPHFWVSILNCIYLDIICLHILLYQLCGPNWIPMQTVKIQMKRLVRKRQDMYVKQNAAAISFFFVPRCNITVLRLVQLDARREKETLCPILIAKAYISLRISVYRYISQYAVRFERETEDLTKLRDCAGNSRPLLIAYATKIGFSCCKPFHV